MVYLLSRLWLQALEELCACAVPSLPDPSLTLFLLLLAVLCGVTDPGCPPAQRGKGWLCGWIQGLSWGDILQTDSGHQGDVMLHLTWLLLVQKQLWRHFIFPLWGLQGAVFMCCSSLPVFFFIPSTLHETVGGNMWPDNGNLLLICQSCSKVFPARTINLAFLSLPCL